MQVTETPFVNPREEGVLYSLVFSATLLTVLPRNLEFSMFRNKFGIFSLQMRSCLGPFMDH